MCAVRRLEGGKVAGGFVEFSFVVSDIQIEGADASSTSELLREMLGELGVRRRVEW